MHERHGGPIDAKSAQTSIVEAVAALAEAASDCSPVAGWTHNFYRYPARFSPGFAAAAIKAFSVPGDLVLDPYMGGGTAVIEGVVAGRRVVGNDLNSLATFICRVKTTPLTVAEARSIKRWASKTVPRFTYDLPRDDLEAFIDRDKTRNLSLVRARFIKKATAAALSSIDDLSSENARDFLKCVLLKVGQWALDGRKTHTSLSEFRSRLAATAKEMVDALALFTKAAEKAGGRATILSGDATELGQKAPFRDARELASLVVTSPPYPGVHVLYHRWQVDGRRETPAPYWIAGCSDGQGAAFYNFGDRKQAAADDYFRRSLETLKAIRRVLRDGGSMIQLVAFNRPDEQLPRYLANMEAAGFAEATKSPAERIWREVPHRKWHACLKGNTHSSNEVVLVHRAV